MADGKGFLTQIENKLGLPKLSKVVESVTDFDPKQIREAKELMDSIERVSKVAPDLDKVLLLFTKYSSMTPPQRRDILKILGYIDHIVTNSPEKVVDAIMQLIDRLPDIMKFLGSLKEE